ncbi:MAG: FliM/FliN family flagellar motor switch protein [Pseudomonadota bacterium]
MIDDEDDAACEFSDPDDPEAPKEQVFEEKRRRAISSVPINVTVAVGRARPQIGELLNMRREAIIPLDNKINDPVEIWVGEHMIARGELQEMEDGSGRLSVRLTEVIELDNVI